MADGEERRWGRKRGGKEICRPRERSLKTRPCASSFVCLGLVDARPSHKSLEMGSSVNSEIYLTKCYYINQEVSR